MTDISAATIGVTDFAKRMGVTRQSVYKALKAGRIQRIGEVLEEHLVGIIHGVARGRSRSGHPRDDQ